MKTLETATYLGTPSHRFQANGLWVSIVNYTQESLLDTSLHAHINAHLTLLLQGGTLEKRSGGRFERLAGQCVFFHAAEAHQNSYTILPSKNINLEFEAHFLQHYGIKEGAIEQAIRYNPDRAFLPLRVYRELIANDTYSADSVAMLVVALLNKTPVAARKIPVWIKRVEELLQDQWNQSITLPQLALAVNVHPVSISKYFPLYFSCTLGEYVRKLKIYRALHLIQNTTFPLTDIAYQCGFYDQIHFTRTFKHFTGLLPKVYRKL